MKFIKNNIQKHLLATTVFFFAMTQMFAPMQVIAACGSSTGTPIEQVQNGVSQTGGDCTGTAVPTLIGNVVNILSIIIGSVAIIMILVAGFRYITSGGEAARVSAAKNTLLYALIGVAVAALAQLLVHFVLAQSVKATKVSTTITSDQKSG